MPQLPTQGQPDVKRFYLPSYAALPIDDQGYVDMDVSPLSGSDMDVYDEVDSGGTVEMTRALIASRITDWNFMVGTEKAPITADSIKTFPLEDYGYLNKQLRASGKSAGLSEDAKKRLAFHLSALRSRANGKEGDYDPGAPAYYQKYLWRRLMNTSFEEAQRTPLAVIMSDLYIDGIEKQFGRSQKVDI